MFKRAIAAAVFLTACPGSAADTVTWLTTGLPPQYIGEGPFAGQGIKDRQFQLIQSEIPEFDHREVKASIGRLWYQMQHEDGVCGIGVLRTAEREQVAKFTERPLSVPGFRVIVKTSHLDSFRAFLQDKDEIDLDLLKQNHRLTGGYIADRAYPQQMLNFTADPILRNRLERSVDADRLYQLLQSNRVDFVFGLGYEATYFGSLHDKSEPLTALPVKGMELVVKGYTACSNGPLGRAVIARLDALQKDDSFWRRWVAPLQRWLDATEFAAALAGQE